MSRTKELYENIENLVYAAIEQGANNNSDIYAYVTMYAPKSLVSYDLVESIVEEYSTNYYEADNVY
jgi:hypothetical protein